MIPINISQMN